MRPSSFSFLFAASSSSVVVALQMMAVVHAVQSQVFAPVRKEARLV